MKRSAHIQLLLLGGVSVGALTACAPPPPEEPRVSLENVYPNDYFIAGAGYYHAPFHAFFPHPYNFYDAAQRRYYFGGRWGEAPYQSAINISAPSAAAVSAAEAARASAVTRGGFGRTGGSHYIYS